MTTLIIPDIHNAVSIAQGIIDAHPADRRVFLGDVYDDFGDTIAQAQAAARWHRVQLADSRNIFLFGNHDMPYAFDGNPLLACSGYTSHKKMAINRILTASDWAKVKLYVHLDGWLISHAGLHPSLGSSITDLET